MMKNKVVDVKLMNIVWNDEEFNKSNEEVNLDLPSSIYNVTLEVVYDELDEFGPALEYKINEYLQDKYGIEVESFDYEVHINKPVGMVGDEVYVLEYVFGKGFSGASGYSMRPLMKQEVEDRKNDIEYLREFWVEAVKDGNTDLGLEEYAEECNEEAEMNDQLFCGDDDSFRADFEDMVEELPQEQKEQIKSLTDLTWSCAGCGRCFSKDMKFDVVFDQELIDLINEYEKEGE